ncbi:hypothetical protein KEM48_004433 [Puccinia striiformis f. sp. tritici PST-130]|nr:hypothetical protein KEM48_004433 [Puccinia striiformis f. sp. tritici PST-130]
MPLSINFKAIRGIIIVGPMAELDHNQIAQHFTPDVVSLLIDHLPEKFLPLKNLRTQLSVTSEKPATLFTSRIMAPDGDDLPDDEDAGCGDTRIKKCVRLLEKKVTETSNDDEGLPLTQGKHDAFIKKLMASFDCEMPLHQSLSICVRIPMVSTCGDRVWIKFNAHQGPSGLMFAEDHSSKFYMNFWARSGDEPINSPEVLSFQERADLDCEVRPTSQSQPHETEESGILHEPHSPMPASARRAEAPSSWTDCPSANLGSGTAGIKPKMRSGKGEEDGDAEEEGDGDMLGWVRLSQLFNEACPWGWGCRLELKLARSPIPVAGCDTWQCRVCETQLVAAEDTCRAVAARLAGSHLASHTRLPVAPQGHPETPTL